MNDTAIAIEGLTHRFGKLTAVDDLHLEVPAGTVCGFLGRNGAGKTTTIQILMNLLQPTAGRAEVLGLDPASDSLALRRQVGYVAENRVMYGWMKIRELVWFTGQFYQTWNQDRVDGLIDRFGLDPEQKVKHLSRGMNAQLALTLALGHEPRLLVLDEPASGLDVVVRRDFLESIIGLIQEEGRTVLLSSHLVHEVERVADRVAIIEKGRLVSEGSVDDVKGSVKRVTVRLQEGEDRMTDIDGLRQVQGGGPAAASDGGGVRRGAGRADPGAGRAYRGRHGRRPRGGFRRPRPAGIRRTAMNPIGALFWKEARESGYKVAACAGLAMIVGLVFLPMGICSCRCQYSQSHGRSLWRGVDGDGCGRAGAQPDDAALPAMPALGLVENPGDEIYRGRCRTAGGPGFLLGWCIHRFGDRWKFHR